MSEVEQFGLSEFGLGFRTSFRIPMYYAGHLRGPNLLALVVDLVAEERRVQRGQGLEEVQRARQNTHLTKLEVFGGIGEGFVLSQEHLDVAGAQDLHNLDRTL